VYICILSKSQCHSLLSLCLSLKPLGLSIQSLCNGSCHFTHCITVIVFIDPVIMCVTTVTVSVTKDIACVTTVTGSTMTVTVSVTTITAEIHTHTQFSDPQSPPAVSHKPRY